MLTVLSLALSRPLTLLFVSQDAVVVELTVNAMHIYSFMFILCGYSLLGSAIFTALNNGLVSASISFLRTLVFETTAVMVLPILFGTSGIWFAVIIAEICSSIVTTFLIFKMNKRYGYMRSRKAGL